MSPILIAVEKEKAPQAKRSLFARSLYIIFGLIAACIGFPILFISLVKGEALTALLAAPWVLASIYLLFPSYSEMKIMALRRSFHAFQIKYLPPRYKQVLIGLTALVLAGWVWQHWAVQQKDKQLLGATIITAFALVNLLPSIMKIAGISLLVLIGGALLIWICYAVAGAVGAIPIAIIIGAIIIAAAVNSQ